MSNPCVSAYRKTLYEWESSGALAIDVWPVPKRQQKPLHGAVNERNTRLYKQSASRGWLALSLHRHMAMRPSSNASTVYRAWDVGVGISKRGNVQIAWLSGRYSHVERISAVCSRSFVENQDSYPARKRRATWIVEWETIFNAESEAVEGSC